MKKRTPAARFKEMLADLKEIDGEHADQKKRLVAALKKKDTKTISYFMKWGDSTGAMLSNVHDIEAASVYGLKPEGLDKNGWVKISKWKKRQVIGFRTPGENKKTMGTQIILAMGPNGKWQFGISYSYGAGGGGGWYPNYHQEPFDTKEICLLTAAKHLHKDFTKQLKRDDPSNVKPAYVRKVLKLIEAYLPKKKVKPFALPPLFQ